MLRLHQLIDGFTLCRAVHFLIAITAFQIKPVLLYNTSVVFNPWRKAMKYDFTPAVVVRYVNPYSSFVSPVCGWRFFSHFACCNSYYYVGRSKSTKQKQLHWRVEGTGVEHLRLEDYLIRPPGMCLYAK